MRAPLALAFLLIAAPTLAGEPTSDLALTTKDLTLVVKDLTFTVTDLAVRVEDMIRVKEAPKEITIELPADILFDFDRSDIRAEAAIALAAAADIIRASAKGTVRIDGHTDSKGTAAHNLVVFVGLERLVRGPWGRVLRAIREDETAASAIGKNARVYRLQAFVLGSAIMGLAGAVQGHFIGFIAPDNYLSALTFQVWAMLIIGGAGNNRGALLGAVAVWGLWSVSSALTATIFPPDQQARAASLQIVMIGVLLAVILVVRPRGILAERMTVSRFVRGSNARDSRGRPDQEQI